MNDQNKVTFFTSKSPEEFATHIKSERDRPVHDAIEEHTIFSDTPDSLMLDVEIKRTGDRPPHRINLTYTKVTRWVEYEGEQVPAEQQEHKAISFMLAPMLEGGTNVSAQCHAEEWRGYYTQLLATIDPRGADAPASIASYDVAAEEGQANDSLTDVDNGLSKREQEVANCLTRGMDRGEIANELVIDKEGVKSHLRHISAKWRLDTTKIAVMQAEAIKRMDKKG